MDDLPLSWADNVIGNMAKAMTINLSSRIRTYFFDAKDRDKKLFNNLKL